MNIKPIFDRVVLLPKEADKETKFKGVNLHNLEILHNCRERQKE